MKRETLEHHQVWIYLTAVLAGLAVGSLAPDAGPFLEILLWPALAFLLYATFTQVPIMQLPDAFRDVRFMAAALIGNFAILPILVWIVLFLVPRDPAIQLGVMLVLLVPCTDWFITFAHQAGGDTRRAIAITPALLLLQIVFLPVYLRLFMGEGFSEIVSADRMMIVFVIVIVLPLAFAWATERWAARDTRRTAVIERLSWLPVPLLAFVLFLIAASQIEAVLSSVPLLGQVLGAFVLFLIGAAFFGVLLSRLFRLTVPQGRTLLFSFATRNSFVVLPLALALPDMWGAVAVVIVFQSLVELFGMLVFLWLVPRKLMP